MLVSRDTIVAMFHGSATPSHPPPSASLEAESPNSVATSPSGEFLNKRRRTGIGSATSSRGVANLTPEQLAKKRANDREAQRAIRERTKKEFERLNEEIRQLREQDEHKELGRLRLERDEARKEIEDMKRRIGVAFNTIGSVLHGVSTNGAFDANSSGWPPPAAERSRVGYASAQSGTREPPRSHYPSSSQYVSQNGRPPSASSANGPAADCPTPTSSGIYVDPRVSSQGKWVGQDLFEEQRRNRIQGFELEGTTERFDFDRLLSSSQRQAIPRLIHPHDVSPGPMHSPARGSPRMQLPGLNLSHSASPSSHIQSTPDYLKLPVYMPSTCPLDSILLDFLYSRRASIRNSSSPASAAAIAGPVYPSVSSLLNPAAGEVSHPLSKIMVDIISKFPHLAKLPEQVATLWGMYTTMRWQIAPSKETYDALPDHLKPVTSPQALIIPHPAWLHNLPWPSMRSTIIRSPEKYPFEEFFIPFTSGLSVNWAYEPQDCLIMVDESMTKHQGGPFPGLNRGLEVLQINPVFERHLREIKNWSLGPEFQKRFPELCTEEVIIREPRVR